MKMYLISDNVDTQIGMRLAGVDGCVVHTAEEVQAEIKKALSDKDRRGAEKRKHSGQYS